MMKSTRDTIMTVLKADPSVTREEREDVEVALGRRVKPKVRIHKGKRISAESVEAVCAGRLSTETKTTKENR